MAALRDRVRARLRTHTHAPTMSSGELSREAIKLRTNCRTLKNNCESFHKLQRYTDCMFRTRRATQWSVLHSNGARTLAERDHSVA